MSLRIDSERFGALELPDEKLVEFPLGLIGIAGHGYAFVDPSPESLFRWLHSTEDPSFALPVVNPLLLHPSFALTISQQEREQIGVEDLSAAEVYVTVSARPDAAESTVNLRAPLVVCGRVGYQVLNLEPDADMRAPLAPPGAVSSKSAA
jgi:flagellar assembly factor FliW